MPNLLPSLFKPDGKCEMFLLLTEQTDPWPYIVSYCVPDRDNVFLCDSGPRYKDTGDRIGWAVRRVSSSSSDMCSGFTSQLSGQRKVKHRRKIKYFVVEFLI